MLINSVRLLEVSDASHSSGEDIFPLLSLVIRVYVYKVHDKVCLKLLFMMCKKAPPPPEKPMGWGHSENVGGWANTDYPSPLGAPYFWNAPHLARFLSRVL
jgi:hypothetical protein